MAIFKRKIKEILTPKVIGADPGEPVARAVGLMREHNISCIVALREGRPAGIITERNITRYMANRGLSFLDSPIQNIMSSPVLSVTGETYIYEAFNILGHSKIRHLVVVDQAGLACGMITQSNLINHLGTEYFREVRRVGQIMSKLVFTAPVDYPLAQALTEMSDKSISCIIAAEKDAPVGVFTERDAVKLADERRDPAGMTLGQVMRSPVACIRESASVREAADFMRIRKIRRLAVTDEAGRLCGLSTQSNLIKGLEGKYIETLKDVIREKESELMLASKDLREKTVYLDNILRSSIDMGIVAAGRDYRINYFNPAAESILHKKSHDVIGRSIQGIHRELGVTEDRMPQALGPLAPGLTHDFTFLSQNGEGPRHIEARVSGIWDDSGVNSGYVLMLKDVTERKKAEEIIRRLAYHDPLTDLPNRALFLDRLNVELAKAKRNATSLTIFMADLDRFKEVNDTMGHHAGDMLLVAISRRLRERLRASDTVARMGGDEFLFLLPETHGPEDVPELARRLSGFLEEPFEIDGREIFVSASLGAAVFPHDGEDAGALIRKADKEMYQHKKTRQCGMSGGAFSARDADEL